MNNTQPINQSLNSSETSNPVNHETVLQPINLHATNAQAMDVQNVSDGGIEAMFEGVLASGLFKTLAMGGPVVMILVLMSVVALAIVLLKLWQFRRLQLHRSAITGELLQLYRQGNLADAIGRASKSPYPGAQLMAQAMRGAQRQELATPSIREELTRIGSHYLALLRSYLRPLEVIAALAPLLGLFGTVLGMIKAFQALQDAGSRVDPSVLAGGIWEALLTTAVGLAVAMPVVAIVHWLESRVERVAREMESAVTQVFTVDLSR